MSQTKYTVAHVPSDLASLSKWTEAQYSAFMHTDNIMHDTLFPPASDPTPADIEAGAKRHLASVQADPEHVKFIWVLDPETGDVAGGAKWGLFDVDANRPEKVVVNWIEAQDEDGELEKKFAQKLMDEFHGRRVKMMKGKHALLDICYTTPKYERKGVASLLVNYGVAIADKNGWRAFTEASPRGEPVYKRKGFVTTEPIRLRWDDEGFGHKRDVVWFHMEREPEIVKG